MVITGCLSIYLGRKIWHTNIQNFADYIETVPQVRNMYIIVKDDKFGVWNNSTKKLQIPCSYDYLEWKHPKVVLTAKYGNDIFDIDINNNRLK